MSVWTRGREREAGAPVAAALVALVACMPFVVGSLDFPLDDAWIHLSYAKSLRAGDGLSYNPGDHETGFSSPLWVLLLAAWPTGTAPVIPVKLLGALLHAGTAWLATVLVMGRLRARASDDGPVPVRTLGLLGGALVATNPILAQAATSGMEVPLSTALLVALTLAVFEDRPPLAGWLGLLATWARPEAVPFALALAGGLWWVGPGHRRAALLGAGGAVAALGVWMAYCLSVSGHPWPNTQYIKGSGGDVTGLVYVLEEVLPWHVWLVSLTGVVLMGRALRSDVRDRRAQGPVLLITGVATIVVVAVTRPLHPGVEFYEARYFATVAWVFPVVLVPGLVGLRGWVSAVLLLPVAVATGLLTSSLHSRTRNLEDDTRRLHREVAHWIAAHAPPQSVLAVEGAGTLRFFTPRSMTIVDVVGLNDRVGAHLAEEPGRKLCYLASREPDYLVIPAHWIPQFAPVFQLDPVTHFHDPNYTQVRPPHPQTVSVLEVLDVTAAARSTCPELGYPLVEAIR